MQAFFDGLAKESPADFPKEGFRALLKNYLDMTVASGTMESSLRLLFGAVGFLLLIACANVANLQLARATSRAREIALRMAVGAGRGRVLRQLLTENTLLSLAGGLLGIALAKGITLGVVALMPDFYKPNEARITLNEYVMAFTAAVAVLTGILFGLAPALQCSRLDLVETLKEATKGSGAGARGGRTRNLLVVVEVALSVVLLVGAGLTVRGFVELAADAAGISAGAGSDGESAIAAEALHDVGAARGIHAEPDGAGGGDSRSAIGGDREWRAAVRRNAVAVFDRRAGGAGFAADRWWG